MFRVSLDFVIFRCKVYMGIIMVLTIICQAFVGLSLDILNFMCHANGWVIVLAFCVTFFFACSLVLILVLVLVLILKPGMFLSLRPKPIENCHT